MSNSSQTEINLPYVTATASGKTLSKTINKAKFEQLADSLIKRTIEPCKTALKAAGMSVSDIDESYFSWWFLLKEYLRYKDAVKAFFG